MAQTNPTTRNTELNAPYWSYVIHLPTLCVVKFGITSRLAERIAELGRYAATRGETKMLWTSIPSLRGVARIVETELRQKMRPWRKPGHLEWVTGGAADYASIVEQTITMQREVASALGVSHV